MVGPDSEFFAKLLAPRAKISTTGSVTFQQVNEENSKRTTYRRRVVHGLGVMVNGATEMVRAVGPNSTRDSAQFSRGAKLVVIGVERAVNATLTGVARRVEGAVDGILKEVKEERKEVSEWKKNLGQ